MVTMHEQPTFLVTQWHVLCVSSKNGIAGTLLCLDNGCWLVFLLIRLVVQLIVCLYATWVVLYALLA
jgi:hypothetical protein